MRFMKFRRSRKAQARVSTGGKWRLGGGDESNVNLKKMIFGNSD